MTKPHRIPLSSTDSSQFTTLQLMLAVVGCCDFVSADVCHGAAAGCYILRMTTLTILICDMLMVGIFSVLPWTLEVVCKKSCFTFWNSVVI